MKKILLTAALALYGLNAASQSKIGNNSGTVNSNAVLELESANQGFLQPRVALSSTTSPSPLAAHVAGMGVYNTATTNDVRPGTYINDGTRWWPVGTTMSTSDVTAVCNGFVGTYYPEIATRSYTVTVTNNTFAAVTVTPVAGDLVLSPASGLSVTAVSGGGSIASGASSVLTYTLGGSLSASAGTVITGTFTKLGLSCVKTVSVSSIPTVTVNGANGTSITFMAHNLGADYSLNPNIPVQGIYGNYYQWGRSAIVANASTPIGAISGWNTASAANGAWSDASKTVNDPCPPGFRVPTRNQWDAVALNNTVSRTGGWANNATNFETALHLSPNASTTYMTLPSFGYRSKTDGALLERGQAGTYQASTISNNNMTLLKFQVNYISTFEDPPTRTVGMPVRCVSQ